MPVQFDLAFEVARLVPHPCMHSSEIGDWPPCRLPLRNDRCQAPDGTV